MTSKWIAWDKQKPHTGQRCIVYVAEDTWEEPIVLAEYDGDYRDGSGVWYWEQGERGYCDEPCRTYCNAKGTFWMPEPDPPEDAP